MLPDPRADFMGWLRALGDDGWITTAEAAALLGMTPGRLCRLRRAARTPPNVAAKLSRRCLAWAAAELQQWAMQRVGETVR